MAAAAKKEKYLVIVRPAPPKKPPLVQQMGQGVQSWQMPPAVTVKEVEATSPEAAADAAGVPPGGSARVVPAKYVKTFKRPEKAPLVAA